MTYKFSEAYGSVSGKVVKHQPIVKNISHVFFLALEILITFLGFWYIFFFLLFDELIFFLSPFSFCQLQVFSGT